MKMIDAEKLSKALGVASYMKTGWVPATAWGVPIVEAEPTHYAHWTIDFKDMTCSECGTWFPNDRAPYMRYCPYCGAKMDKDEWEEPEINPCRGCDDYDGRGGCKSNGGCGK